MKKSLIALAAAFAGSAYAGSSVTLYGIADAWVGSQKTLVAGAPLSQTGINNGGLSGSRLGFSIKEDLGNDMHAMATIETAVAIDAPAATALGDRRATVGLSGAFGTIQAGRIATPYDDMLKKVYSGAQDDSQFSAGYRAAIVTHNHTARTNNSLRYDSPDFGGITGAVQIAFDENKGAAVKASRDTALSLQYKSGPLTATVATQKDDATGAANNEITNTLVAGSYKLGDMTIGLGLNNSKDTATNLKEKSSNVSFAMPLGPVKLMADVGRAKLDGANAIKSIGLEAHYALSKRTTAYAGIGQWKRDVLGANAAIDSRNAGLGVRHKF